MNEERPNIGSVPGFDKAFVESVMVKGGALKDKLRTQSPVLRSENGSADPFASVTKLDIAYSLVQMLGLEEAALSFDPNADIVVDYNGEQIVLEDQDSIPADMKGYVQLALTLSLINAEFGVEQSPFSITPTITASFAPDTVITRAHYAVLASRFFAQYFE